jgi:hypothetical protein
MDDAKARIIAYVAVLDSTLDTDDEAFLFVVDEIVDRVLVYTNRYQFIDQFEDDLEDYGEDEGFWEGYSYPIPPQLERVIARTVIDTIKSHDAQTESKREVSSLSDHGQTVTYSGVRSYLSQSDANLFRESLSLLNKFRVPTIVANT